MNARVAKDHLKAFVERIERLHEERKSLSDDIRDVYAEAKGSGFDVKELKTVIRMRGQDLNERREQEAIVETYLHALGMLPDFEAPGTDDATRAPAREESKAQLPDHKIADDPPRTTSLTNPSLLPDADAVKRIARAAEKRGKQQAKATKPLARPDWVRHTRAQLAEESESIRRTAAELADTRGRR